MPDENLLATLEQGLRQSRATRGRLATRLAELEADAEKVRTEIAEMDALANQTEAAMFRILSSVLGSGAPTNTPSDAVIEAALRHDAAKSSMVAQHQIASRSTMPPVRPETEAKDNRFFGSNYSAGRRRTIA